MSTSKFEFRSCPSRSPTPRSSPGSKQPGDAVSRDENLVDLETDKVVLEVPAPASGVLRELKVQNGATVTSGQVLAVIEEGAVAHRRRRSQRRQPGAAPRQRAARERTRTSSRPRCVAWSRSTSSTPAEIAGSGRDGRITKGDVLTHLADKSAAAGAGRHPRRARPHPRCARPRRGAGAVSRGERRVPMTRLRARIAERLVQAQSTAAMLTTFNEVDLKAVNELRARYKDRFEKEHGARLGFMSFFVKACVEALKRFPVVNASVDGNDIVYHEYYDIGVAVSTERGLIVPVLRDADQMSFGEIEKAVVGYATRAREGPLSLEELTGGTFTITNGGVFGSLLSTPILNMPQSAILGMHKIQERPVVVDGAGRGAADDVPRAVLRSPLIDGREAVQFLVAVKEALEDPARLLLQI